MSKQIALKSQIEHLCKQYKAPFCLDNFLDLIIFATRNLDVLEQGKSPIGSLEDKIQTAKESKSFEQLYKLNNLIGTLATLFHYLKTQLGDLLLYRDFVELVVQYIGERDPRFKLEMKTEQAIFLSMVYEPMKWFRFLGKNESAMQVREVQLKFDKLTLPNLRTLRVFLMDYLTCECVEQLKIYLRANSMFKGKRKSGVIAERKSDVMLANRLLTWLNDKKASLDKEDLKAVTTSGKLSELEEHLQPLIMKRCY